MGRGGLLPTSVPNGMISPPSARAFAPGAESPLSAAPSRSASPYGHSRPGPASSSPAGGSESIQVVVRVRPLSHDERARGDVECVYCADDGCTVQWMDEGHARGSRGVMDRSHGLTTLRSLTVDACLAGSAQAPVFQAARAENLLMDALSGYSVTIFAYGQTGSGKTFTMTGPDSIDYGREAAAASLDDGPHGLIPRVLSDLFELTAHGREHAGVTVSASYLEIYNEQLNDLLNPASVNLQLRHEARLGPFVQNLLQVECESLGDAMAVLAEGTRNRKVSSHQLNKDSSRSHCLMTLHLKDANTGCTGRISLVDLAGSERLKDSCSEGAMASETGHINRSLFALGNVISSLSDARRRQGHIPYRDSKLTKLLMDSLGGDGRTLMLACVSPSLHMLEETANTLLFASRAKNIQNRPTVQVDAQGLQLQQLQASMRALQEENADLGRRLAAASAAPRGFSSEHAARPSEPSPESAAPASDEAPGAVVAVESAAPFAAAWAGTSSSRGDAGRGAGIGGGAGGGAGGGGSCSRSEQHELAALRLENERLRNSSESLRRSNELLQASR